MFGHGARYTMSTRQIQWTRRLRSCSILMILGAAPLICDVGHFAPHTNFMNLKQYLSQKGKAKGKTKAWLPFCTLDVKTGKLWAGDPHHPLDRCVVKVPPGRYVVEGIGLAWGRDRIVSRLRVRLKTVKNPTIGKELDYTGTDSGMIGVCEIG